MFDGFDFREPDYMKVIAVRKRRLELIRSGDINLATLRLFYKDHIADFINDWGMTVDPRNLDLDLPATIPFILFDRQREWVDWLMRKWRSRSPGITEKSRDMGLSWLMTATAVSLCLFYPGMAIGFGSRKQEYVDKLGDPKCLFYKARVFIRNLPREFRGPWVEKDHAPHMRLMFPWLGSSITGEAGDNIGRGDRAAIYFTDEDAYIEHPDLVDASLSQTTNCRIRVSSVRGMANSFAIKRHEGKIDVFTFHWRDDPRKDDSWYAKQCEELDEVIVAQEIDINYAAAVHGALIPSAWVQAAIDAHITLGWPEPTGRRIASLDVADQGGDLNAMVSGHGSIVDFTDEWSGQGSDLYRTTQRAFANVDELEAVLLRYDANGVGAGVRGDGNRINEVRKEQSRKTIPLEAFIAIGVDKPNGEDVKGRKNIDFFENRKAQAGWALRHRFEKTWRAVTKGMTYPVDELISIKKDMKLRAKLVSELSQPEMGWSKNNKVIIEKTPDGAKSPNLYDALVMWSYHGSSTGFTITDDVIAKSKSYGMAAALAQRGRH